VSSDVCLTGLHQEFVPFLTRMFGLGFLSKSFGSLFHPIRKSEGVLETASLHGAAPFLRKAGAQPAFSSPMTAEEPCGDELSVHPPNWERWSKLNTGGALLRERESGFAPQYPCVHFVTLS
jgi:hypothetical protein